MNIHEYQGKEILRQYGVSVPNGRVAFTVDEAVEAAKELGTEVVVVKAQIHAGGRGKAGGVKVAKNLDEARTYAEEILGKTLGPIKQVLQARKLSVYLLKKAATLQKNIISGWSLTVLRTVSY